MLASKPSSVPKPLLSYSGGIMVYKDGTVTASPERGKITFSASKYDDIIEVRWKSRDNGKKVVNLPKGGVEVINVTQCKDGKVFLLKLKDSQKESDHHFFWFHEKLTPETHESRVEAIRKLFKPSVSLVNFQKLLSDISSSAPKGTRVGLTDIIKSSKLKEALNSDPTFFISKLAPHTFSKNLNPSNLVEEVTNQFVCDAAGKLQNILSNPDVFAELCKLYDVPVDSTGKEAGVSALLKALEKGKK